MATTESADARSRHHRHHAYHVHHSRVSHASEEAGSYSPPSAAIVVDANSGEVMHAENPDATRHPASLTKIMTLYLLFERLESGKIRLDTPLRVSEHAASMAPSKLGLKPGDTIAVEDAIKAVVTKSANDVAAVIAEALGGTEEEFAAMMTRKAHALGMLHTTYVNASGLPDEDQNTTARDQATLGRAIQDRFPKEYTYFSTHYFTFHGNSMRNHNHLLGSVEGVDGIKTGYTRASGFNLVTSLRRGNRWLVAVVLGGHSGGARDARMRDLLGQYITTASIKRTAPVIAEDGEKSAPTLAAVAPVATTKVASAAPLALMAPAAVPASSMTSRADATATATISAARPAPSAGSTDPLRPVLVRTLSVKPGATKVASLAALTAPISEVASTPAVEPKDVPAPPAAAAKGGSPVAAPAVTAASKPVEAPVRVVETPAPKPQAHTGWIVQVGAYESAEEAKQRLSSAKTSAARLLASADAFTESTLKGDKTYYRARFAGLDKNQAEAACKYLKRNEFACFTSKN